MECMFCGRGIHKLTWWEVLTGKIQSIRCNPGTRYCYDGLRKKMGLGPATDQEWAAINATYEKAAS